MKSNNQFYADIEIDYIALQTLPQTGIPADLLTLEEECSSTQDVETGPQSGDDEQVPAQTDLDCHSLLPIPQQQRQAIRAAVNAENPLDWPTISGEPINEFQTEGLCTIAFPTLFPHGKGKVCYKVINGSY